MTRRELREAVVAYGFHHRPEAEINRLLDVATMDVTTEEPWAFRQAKAAGPLPLSIADLGTLDLVLDSAGGKVDVVRASEGRRLRRDAGLPVAVWLEGDATIAGVPVGAEVEVFYYGLDCWASGGQMAAGDEDTPLLPARFHTMLVSLAVAELFDESTSAEMATVHRQRADLRLDRLRRERLIVHGAGPDSIEATGGFG